LRETVTQTLKKTENYIVNWLQKGRKSAGFLPNTEAGIIKCASNSHELRSPPVSCPVAIGL
jgi:hypothetical protein